MSTPVSDSLSDSRSPSRSRRPSPSASTLPPLLAELTFFLVPAKLDVPAVDAQIAALGGQTVGRAQDARVLVTALRGRPRLERVLGRGAVDAHKLVSPAYISDAYAAAEKGGTVPPPRTAYLVFGGDGSGTEHDHEDHGSDGDHWDDEDKEKDAKDTEKNTKGGGARRKKRKGTRSPSVEVIEKRARVSGPAAGTRGMEAMEKHKKEDKDKEKDKDKDKGEGKGDEEGKGKEKENDKEKDKTKGGAKGNEEGEEGGQKDKKREGKDKDTEKDAEKAPLPDVAPYPEDIPLRDIPRMCVERPCPLVCPNQDIIDAIKPIYTAREYDESEQKNSHVLSYRRSMSMLKSVPRRLKSGAEARKLIDVGEKVAQRIDEFLSTGEIAESAEIVSSERFQTLQTFASIYTIGTSTAVDLWDRGCRTLEDVRRHYCGSGGQDAGNGDGDGGGGGGGKLLDPHRQRAERREDAKAFKRRSTGTMTQPEVVAAWLDLKDQLDAPISRSEAEKIAQNVMDQVEALHPGCEWTITGGYRRGKPTVTDVDVVFSPPEPDADLLKAVVRRMVRLGIITHVLHISTTNPNAPLHSHGGNFDNLDKAFVIMQLDGVHHRVDLICAPHARYAAAVLSWSGSMMYERDLRRVAEERGYKFRAGLIDSATNNEINLPSEREILAFLGLPYVPPELRNADG